MRQSFSGGQRQTHSLPYAVVSGAFWGKTITKNSGVVVTDRLSSTASCRNGVLSTDDDGEFFL